MKFQDFCKELEGLQPEGHDNLCVRIVTLVGELAEFAHDYQQEKPSAVEELGDCFAAAAYLKRLCGISMGNKPFCLTPLAVIADLSKVGREILISGGMVTGRTDACVRILVKGIVNQLLMYDFADKAMVGAIKKQKELWGEK